MYELQPEDGEFTSQKGNESQKIYKFKKLKSVIWIFSDNSDN